MGKVILQGHIEVSEVELDSVLEELPKHIQLTLNETGCIIFQVQQDADDTCTFHVYEEFESEDAFKYHQQRVKNSSWGKAAKNVKRFYSVASEES